MELYLGPLIIAIICTVLALVSHSKRTRLICTFILLLLTLWGCVVITISHRSAMGLAHTGAEAEITKQYSEKETDALRRGITLHLEVSERTFPLFLIPSFALFVLANRKIKTTPNQQVDPIVKTSGDEVEAQGTQGHP